MSGRSLRPSSPGMGRWCGLRDDKVRCRVAHTRGLGLLLGNRPPMNASGRTEVARRLPFAPPLPRSGEGARCQIVTCSPSPAHGDVGVADVRAAQRRGWGLGASSGEEMVRASGYLGLGACSGRSILWLGARSGPEHHDLVERWSLPHPRRSGRIPDGHDGVRSQVRGQRQRVAHHIRAEDRRAHPAAC